MAKQPILKLVVAALFLFSAGAYGQATVSTTPHNMNTPGGGSLANPGSDGRVCAYCHTPHAANTGVPAPLWNRNAPGGTFTMYNATVSPTIDMVVAAQPQGVSMACLGCHEGSIGIDSLFNPPTGWGALDGDTIGTVNADANFGLDLTNDHPISVTYSVGAGANQDPDFQATPSNSLPLFGTGADQVECGSCHSVHDNTNAPFLWVANTNSNLCLSCHVK